jgi:D-serine deaminase-like pyridoxal phosphate-dependent protein
MRPSPNATLIGGPLDHPDLATPALVLDRAALAANVAAMAGLAAARGIGLRPHGKAHKSGRIGRMQVEAGALGVCAATLLELETMAAAGIDGALLTTPVVTPSLVDRAVAARARVAGLGVVVDSGLGVALLASRARPEAPLDVLVDVDMGLRRDGVASAGEAVALARAVADAPGLRLRGVQAYYGHLQHVPALADRLARCREQWARLADVLAALAAAGLPAEIVSGGGTGTHHADLAEGPFTELQPGSYLFMDKQYGAVELAPGAAPFATALGVVGRVVSVAQPDRVIVDAGAKALSTDAGPAPVAWGAPEGASYAFMGDEHGAVMIPEGAPRPALGALIGFVAPHCDPTVNLHDAYHVVEDGRLVGVWPIEARGH